MPSPFGTIIKLDDNTYIEWSSVVDAPVSYLMTREEAVRHASPTSIDENGVAKDLAAGEERVARADRTGISQFDFDGTVESFVKGNRAGENETELTVEEIIREYRQPMKDET